jgi:serine phosphatase RsbU (regulator of sigma subunit)
MANVEALVAAAKIGKYASSESGDTLEMVERPSGGISFILADGQRSGKPAKAIANVVTRKALSLLADEVRDGAAARAASDYLYTYRSGQVVATLNILSIDTHSQTLVIVRNNPAPVMVIEAGALRALDAPSQAVGSRKGIRPEIQELPLQEGLRVVVYTDGLIHAGDREGQPFDIISCIQDLSHGTDAAPSFWADHLLEKALLADDSRASDDITVLVAAIQKGSGDDVRRLSVQLTL